MVSINSLLNGRTSPPAKTLVFCKTAALKPDFFSGQGSVWGVSIHKRQCWEWLCRCSHGINCHESSTGKITPVIRQKTACGFPPTRPAPSQIVDPPALPAALLNPSLLCNGKDQISYQIHIKCG